MKKIINSLLLLASTVAFSQQTTNKAEVQWGTEYEVDKKVTLSDIVGYDASGIYALKSNYIYNDKSPIIAFYDNNMNLVKSTELELKQENKYKKFENIIQFNNNLYLFTSFKNQKLEKNFLFVQTINKSTLTPNDDIIKIAEIDFSGKSKYNGGTFSCIISPDSSKLLVYYDMPYESGTNEKFGFQSYDKQMNLLWQKDVTLPYLEKLFDVERYRIDNNGNAYILGRLYKDKKVEKRKGEPNYEYKVISYTNNGSSVNEYPITIQGKFITDMQIAIDDNMDIICGGFYSDEGTYSIKGCYYLRIDGTTKEIKTQSYKEFGLDFLTQFLSEKEAEKLEKKVEKGKNVELYEYDLHEIIRRTDGGAVLIAEQYYVQVVTTSYRNANGTYSTTTTYYYNYNDIIVINISPSGNIEWATKIRKYQRSANDGGYFSSYALAVVNDKLYFIFNDNPKNLYAENNAGKIYGTILNKECVVSLVEIDGEGNQTREALFKANEAEVYTRPKVCEQVSPNELIVFGQKKKMQRFAKIIFKN